jgi:hypothetical protein
MISEILQEVYMSIKAPVLHLYNINECVRTMKIIISLFNTKFYQMCENSSLNEWKVHGFQHKQGPDSQVKVAAVHPLRKPHKITAISI